MARGQKTDICLHVIEVYVSWINCCLAESSLKLVGDISQDLHDGLVLGHLILFTTGCNVIQNSKPSKNVEKCENVQSVIDFMQEKGIDVPFEAEDIVSGDLKSILDAVWLIILHFEIHSANRATYQRTVSMGKRFLLEWLAKELPDVIIDTRGPFLELLQNGVFLLGVISKYCAAVSDVVRADIQKVTLEDFTMAVEAAATYLDVPSKIISPSAILDATINEYALIIYVAIMRHKISAINKEEPHKGGAKVELTPPVTPLKQRSRTTPERRRITPTGSPRVLRSPASGIGASPLSPSSLKNLVDQQATSHAAIQALQERIQASPYQTATPRLQKKLPTISAVFSMAPTAEGVSQSDQNSPPKAAEKVEHPQGPLALDQNDNFLGKAVENSWKLPEVTNGRRGNLYSNVDRQFLEFMLDAVNRGYVPDELVMEGKAPLSNGLPEKAPGEELVERAGSKQGAEGPYRADATRREPSQVIHVESYSRLTDSKRTAEAQNGISRDESEPIDISIRDEGEPIDISIRDEGEPRDDDISIEGGQSVGSQIGESLVPLTAEDPEVIVAVEKSVTDQNTPKSTKRSELNLLDIEDEEVTHTCSSSVVESRSTVSQTQPDVQNSLLVTDVEGSFLRDKPMIKADDDLHGDSDMQVESLCGEDVESDPFMIYLDSIEHSALKFKLQVERAKIDTLLTLKSKLEEAYEGTPLEEIPSKFGEKLQEAIAQLTSEDVMETFSDLVEKQDGINGEDTADLVDYLKNELDSVAAENFRLNQQLEVLKEYEDVCHEMKEQVDVLNEEIVEIRSNFEEKKGESEFLAERVDELEKGIFNMRVEYEEQVREMQEETLQLHLMLMEMENKTGEEAPLYPLNGSMQENGEALGEALGNEVENFSERDNTEYFPLQSELESMRFRLEESERRNESLRTVTAADQSLIKSLENKVADLENALEKSHDDSERYLCELQEAHLQHSSDRAKLSSFNEETEALGRENALLKSSLKIAENEIEYLQGKGKRSAEPWKYNRKQIWREICELEKIMKDVHKEKRRIEKKYVSFKHETDIANNSLTSYDPSPPQSPESAPTLPRHHSPAASEDSATNDTLPRDIATPPQKVQSWIEDLHTPSGMETSVAMKQNSGSSDSVQSPTGFKVSKPSGSPLSQELQKLRSHVGNLEAERTAIVKELSSLRSSSFES